MGTYVHKVFFSFISERSANNLDDTVQKSILLDYLGNNSSRRTRIGVLNIKRVSSFSLQHLLEIFLDVKNM
jgi:hypothetical protein